MQRQCQRCGRVFTAQRSTAKWCSSNCKMQNHFNPKPRPALRPVANHPLVVVTRKELEAAGCLDSALGLVAIGLAEAMCAPDVANAALVAASKELSRVMAEALGQKPT